MLLSKSELSSLQVWGRYYPGRVILHAVRPHAKEALCGASVSPLCFMYDSDIAARHLNCFNCRSIVATADKE